MEKYKLKKDARKFFDKKFSEIIKPRDFWSDNEIPIQLLDETEKAYIEYGHKSGEHSAFLKGFSFTDKKADIPFTLYVDMEYGEYENISISDLMDEMQIVINKYFKS